MKNKALLLLTLLLTITNNAFSQFDSIIFSKSTFLDGSASSAVVPIYKLGDQNNDGYDDFMFFECDEDKLLLFYGGNPVDSIPDLDFYMDLPTAFSAIDLNGDGIKDIITTTRKYAQDSVGTLIGTVLKIYNGGLQLDTVPDFVHTFLGVRGHVVNDDIDFNGDGANELVLSTQSYPYQTEPQIGIYTFFNSYPVLDTIPEMIISGDTSISRRIEGLQTGDFNGDGKTDITIYGYTNIFPYPNQFRNFYLGNSNWDSTVAFRYNLDEHAFDIRSFQVIKDINRDNKDDILIISYGAYFPSYYYNSILYGSFPIDTIPDVGLNTQNVPIEYALINTGDVNGDGYNDMLASMVTFYPSERLWLGGNNMPALRVKSYGGTSNGNGRGFGGVGDVNGDGADDFAICEIPYLGVQSCKHSIIRIYAGDTSYIVNVEDEPQTLLPNSFKLEDPYPNPFNPGFTIKWQNAEQSNIRITLYDLLGNQIAVFINEELKIGFYQKSFDLSSYNLSSGVYFLEFIATKNGAQIFSVTKKIVQLK